MTHETTPDDIAGMSAAVGILTQTGGATSHAAVVARAMDRACVVGCTDLDFSKCKAAASITIDGSTGRAWVENCLPTNSAKANCASMNTSNSIAKYLASLMLLYI